jgi:hypothetical protein
VCHPFNGFQNELPLFHNKIISACVLPAVCYYARSVAGNLWVYIYLLHTHKCYSTTQRTCKNTMTTTSSKVADHHLETIDYKPPAPSAISCNINDEKKMDDNGAAAEEDGNDKTGDEEHAEEGDGQFDLYSEEAEWDEGGKSHCGYAEVVHSTLMSVGETVHKLVGEPTPYVEKELKAVGNWFQEASYAARDLFRTPQEGEESSGMQEDAIDAVKTLLRGGSHMQDDEGEQQNNATDTSTSAAITSEEPVGQSSN